MILIDLFRGNELTLGLQKLTNQLVQVPPFDEGVDLLFMLIHSFFLGACTTQFGGQVNIDRCHTACSGFVNDTRLQTDRGFYPAPSVDWALASS